MLYWAMDSGDVKNILKKVFKNPYNGTFYHFDKGT